MTVVFAPGGMTTMRELSLSTSAVNTTQPDLTTAWTVTLTNVLTNVPE